MCQLIKERHRITLELTEAERLTLQEGMRHHPRPAMRERCAALRHRSLTELRPIGWPATGCSRRATRVASTTG